MELDLINVSYLIDIWDLLIQNYGLYMTKIVDYLILKILKYKIFLKSKYNLDNLNFESFMFENEEISFKIRRPIKEILENTYDFWT